MQLVDLSFDLASLGHTALVESGELFFRIELVRSALDLALGLCELVWVALTFFLQTGIVCGIA